VLKQAEMGVPVTELIRIAGISEQPFCRRKKQFTAFRNTIHQPLNCIVANQGLRLAYNAKHDIIHP
jgi:hypothetical protein